MIKCVIFDFNRTLYDPEKDGFFEGVMDVLTKLKNNGFKLLRTLKNSQ